MTDPPFSPAAIRVESILTPKPIPFPPAAQRPPSRGSTPILPGPKPSRASRPAQSGRGVFWLKPWDALQKTFDMHRAKEYNQFNTFIAHGEETRFSSAYGIGQERISRYPGSCANGVFCIEESREVTPLTGKFNTQQNIFVIFI